MKSTIIKCLAFGSALLLASRLAADPNDSSSSSTNAAAAPSNKMVIPQDKLAYAVAEDPAQRATPLTLIVDLSTNIHFPVSLGYNDEIVINASGKTISEIRQELKKKLDATYYKNATVTLEQGAATVQPGQIVITGPVRNNFVPLLPGEHLMLLETILRAGPSEFANLKKVKIMRINEATGKVDEKIVDVEAIEKNPKKDVPVFPGDRINLIEKNILFQ